ncbi:Uncharacterised protein [Acinetobacter baumannii]|nr:Uncharacterised protein [Acinetobacter baumannii]
MHLAPYIAWSDVPHRQVMSHAQKSMFQSVHGLLLPSGASFLVTQSIGELSGKFLENKTVLLLWSHQLRPTVLAHGYETSLQRYIPFHRAVDNAQDGNLALPKYWLHSISSLQETRFQVQQHGKPHDL